MSAPETTTPVTGSNVVPEKPPLWTPQFLLLLVSATFMYLMTFMLTPTLPLYVVDVGAGSTATGGVIVALYTAGSLLPRLMWGRLADRRGRRVVFVIGVVVMTILSPLYPVFALLPAILLLRLLQGVGFSAASTAASTMAADLVPPSRRAEGIGYYALANTIGMALGPNLGLAVHQGAGALWLFLVSAAGGVVSLLVVTLVRYERRARPAEPSPVPAGAPPATRQRLVERSVLGVCVAFLFIVMPYGAVMTYVAAYGLDEGVGDVGLWFTVFAVALFAVRLGVGRLSDRYGTTVAFVPAAVAMIVGLVILGQAHSFAAFMVSAVVFGLGYGVCLPLLQTAAFAIAPSDRRGAASATVFSTADIAYGVGALLLGGGIAIVGYSAAFTALAALVVVALGLYLLVVRRRLRTLETDHGR